MITAAEKLPAAPKARTPREVALIVEADETTWRTLAVFCGYRVVLALFVAAAFTFLNRFFNLGAQSPLVVVPTLIAYALVSLLLLIPARLREPNLTIQVTVGVFVDVIAIVMLMYASGGVRSGLGVILLVSLAAAGLITRGRLAYFHAAIAALAVLLEQTFQLWRHDAGPQDFVQAGLTAGAFFATAGLASALARYARTSEQIAEERKVDLANLSQINEIVIRDMQDGILVVDGEGRIRQQIRAPCSCWAHSRRAAGRRSPTTRPRSRAARRLAQGRRDRRSCSCASARAGGELQVHFVPIGSGRSGAHGGVHRGRGPHARPGAADEAGGARAAHRLDRARDPQPALLDRPRRGAARRRTASSTRTQAAACAIIRGNVHRLDRIVQEVLYLNRRDRAQPESIDPLPYLQNFADEFCATEKCAPETIDVQVRTTQRLWFDRQHLDQVLWNILRNALRHCRGLSRLDPHRGVARAAPGRLLIDVHDDGPGVSRENQSHLFEPFFTTATQGTGLGLYIARELCEGNGARLEYVENPAGGQFRITVKGA